MSDLEIDSSMSGGYPSPVPGDTKAQPSSNMVTVNDGCNMVIGSGS